MVTLFLKDNATGHIREYGENQHDTLVLQPDGSLHYENLQNGTGTKYPEEGYTFVCRDGSDPRKDPHVYKYGIEPYLDVGGSSHTEEPYLRGVALDKIASHLGVYRAIGETDHLFAKRLVNSLSSTEGCT